MENYSDSNLVNITLEDWNKDISYVLLPDTLILFVYLVIGLTGNGSVIAVYYTWKYKSDSEDRYLIPFLAVCDLMASVVIPSFHITLNMKPVTFESDKLCKSLCFLNGFLTYVSISVLLTIAVQRYIKICRPSKGFVISIRAMRYICIFIVIFTMVLASPIILFYGSTIIHMEGTNLTGYKCKRRSNDGYNLQFKVYGSLLVFILILIIVSLSFIYIKIGYKLYIHFRKMKRHSHSGSEVSSSGKTTNEISLSDYSRGVQDNTITDSMQNDASDRSNTSNISKKKNDKTMYRISLIFLTITVAFILSYVPRVIVLLAEGLTPNYWQGLSDGEMTALVFVHQIYLINNIINPIIYGVMDKRFRKEFKRMVRNTFIACTCQ